MKEYPTHQHTLKNGETLVYRESGQGDKKVLLVHGNMSSSVHWQPLIEVLEDTCHVVAVDLRGFGDSTYNKPVSSLRDFAEDVSELIETLDLTFDVAAGWSTGGGILLELAILQPQRIKRVLLLDSVGIQGYPMYKKDAAGKPILTERVSSWDDIAVDPVQVLPVLEAYRDNNRDLLRYIWDVSIYHENKPSNADYEAYLDAIFKQRNLVDVNYALIHFNMLDESNGVEIGSGRYKDVKQPLIIVHGVLDRVVPFAEAEKYKEVYGEQAQLISVDGAGHSVLTDNLEALRDAIVQNI